MCKLASQFCCILKPSLVLLPEHLLFMMETDGEKLGALPRPSEDWVLVLGEIAFVFFTVASGNACGQLTHSDPQWMLYFTSLRPGFYSASRLRRIPLKAGE